MTRHQKELERADANMEEARDTDRGNSAHKNRCLMLVTFLLPGKKTQLR